MTRRTGDDRGREMSNEDILSSLSAGPGVEVVVKGSRFLGQAFPADSEEEALEVLGGVRRRHHDATHHCWAFRLCEFEDPHERHSDDGEPSGSAGAPILGSLRRASVVRALVVVTRYFGGVKLGTGGLTRAYGEAARCAVDASPERVLLRVTDLEIRAEYAQLGVVETILARSGGAIREVQRVFEPNPLFRVAVLRGSTRALREELVHASAGRLHLSALGDRIAEK